MLVTKELTKNSIIEELSNLTRDESEVNTMAFEYLSGYATFGSVEDMDENVKQHINKYRLDLTKSERAIVFMIAGRSLIHVGASHLKASTIADVLKISTKTVYRTVKKLVEFSIIEKVPQPKLNGIKGASIYKILPFENNVPSAMSERVTTVGASYDVASEPIYENLSIKSFNLLSSKQANNIYNLGEELALQAENKKEYMNEYQSMLYDFLHSLPFADTLKDELHKIVLASQIDSVQAFHKAKNVFMNIVSDIKEGTLTVASTLRAVFKGAYDKASQYSKPSTVDVVVEDRKTVPFYDWLNERGDNAIANKNYKPIENWLEW